MHSKKGFFILKDFVCPHFATEKTSSGSNPSRAFGLERARETGDQLISNNVVVINNIDWESLCSFLTTEEQKVGRRISNSHLHALYESFLKVFFSYFAKSYQSSIQRFPTRQRIVFFNYKTRL